MSKRDEKLERMLSGYYKREAPYTFRLRQKTKKQRREWRISARPATIASLLIVAFVMGIFLHAGYPELFEGSNSFSITADAAPGDDNPYNVGISSRRLGILKTTAESDYIELELGFNLPISGNNVKNVRFITNYAKFALDYDYVEYGAYTIGRERGGVDAGGIICTNFTDGVSESGQPELIQGARLVIRMNADEDELTAEAIRTYYNHKTGAAELKEDELRKTLTTLYERLLDGVNIIAEVSFEDGSSQTVKMAPQYDKDKSSYSWFAPIIRLEIYDL